MSAPAPGPKTRTGPLVALLAVVSLAAVLTWWPTGKGTDAPAGIPGAERARLGRGTTDPSSVPDLARIAPRGEAAGEVARNVFRFYDTPIPTPTPLPTPRPTPIGPGSPLFVGPMPIRPTPTPTPIVPPAIPYKVLGKFGERDRPIVALEEGGRIINAREGDVVDGRFRIHKINRESVDFSFPGLPPEITRRIPIPLP
jgi:hypothetical protein